MRTVVLYAPHLGRDITGLVDALPGLIVQRGEPTLRGCDGCLEGHKTAIREAMMLGEDRLFVVEDDCRFTPAFSRDRWEEDVDWAQRHGFDVVVGGSTRTYDERRVRTGMLEVEAFHSAHCVAYLGSGFERALTAVQPYDLSLGRDCGLRCVVVYPFVAVQRPSFSGILQQQVDYVPLYEQHEAALGRLMCA